MYRDEEVWTDMRPLSLRKRMEELAQEKQSGEETKNAREESACLNKGHHHTSDAQPHKRAASSQPPLLTIAHPSQNLAPLE